MRLALRSRAGAERVLPTLPCGRGPGVGGPAGEGLSHLASRAGAIRPPNYEIIEVLR